MYVVVGITHTEDHRETDTDTDELDSRRRKPEISAARSFEKGSRNGTSECGIASSSNAPVTGRTDGRSVGRTDDRGVNEVGNRARLQVGGVRACFGFSVISTSVVFSFFFFRLANFRNLENCFWKMTQKKIKMEDFEIIRDFLGHFLK